jgi:hypothetical protein
MKKEEVNEEGREGSAKNDFVRSVGAEHGAARLKQW